MFLIVEESVILVLIKNSKNIGLNFIRYKLSVLLFCGWYKKLIFIDKYWVFVIRYLDMIWD